VASLAPVEATDGDSVRFRCAQPHCLNPQLIARLAERDIAVVGLAPVPRSLEDVYLRIIAGEDVDRGDWKPASNGRLPAGHAAPVTSEDVRVEA